MSKRKNIGGRQRKSRASKLRKMVGENVTVNLKSEQDEREYCFAEKLARIDSPFLPQGYYVGNLQIKINNSNVDFRNKEVYTSVPYYGGYFN